MKANTPTFHTLSRTNHPVSLHRGLCLLGMMILSLALSAQAIYNLRDSLPVHPLNAYLLVYEDTSQHLTAETILADSEGTRFRFRPLSEYERPLDRESAYWAKIALVSQVPLKGWYLELVEKADFLSSSWDRGNGVVDLWQYEGSDILHHERTGSDVPAREKSIPREFNVARFPFSIQTGDTAYLLLRIEGNNFLMAPSLNLVLKKPEPDMRTFGFFSYTNFSGYQTFMSMVLGGFFMAFLYHFILFLYLREEVYGWFSLWLIGPIIAADMNHPTGYISEHLIANLPFLRNYFWTCSTLMVWIVFWQFGRKFIGTREKYPRLDKLILGIIILLCLNLFVSLLTSALTDRLLSEISIYYLQILALTNLIGVGISIYLISRKDLLSRYFGAGSLVANLGVIIGAMWSAGVLPLHFDPFITAIILQLLIYSFGLAYRRQVFYREKQETEHKLLESEQARVGQLEEVNRITSRFVPAAFIESIGKKSLLDVHLDDQVSKEVTVFFSDIRDFTSRSERRNPEENFRFVREYVNVVEPIIRKHGGFVHQFVGDGLMAIFDQSPAEALRAANEMQAAIRQHFPHLSVGMGMHTGSLVMGIIGNEERMDPAIISDTVNTASRMEGLTKVFGSAVLLSESSQAQLKPEDGHHIRFLGKVQVKGRSSSLGIYESLDGLDHQTREALVAGQEDFSRGLHAYYVQDFEGAVISFQKALAFYYEDPAAQRFLRKAKAYLESGVPEDWTGVEKMGQK